MCKIHPFVISCHVDDVLALDEHVAANAEKNTCSASWRKHLSHSELCMHKSKKKKAKIRQTIDWVVLKNEVTVELDDIKDMCVGCEWCHRWSREAVRLLMFRVDHMIILAEFFLSESITLNKWSLWCLAQACFPCVGLVQTPQSPPSTPPHLSHPPVVSALQPDIIQQRLYKRGPAVTKETIRVKHHTCCAVTALPSPICCSSSTPPPLLLLLHIYFSFSSSLNSSTTLPPRPPHPPILLFCSSSSSCSSTTSSFLPQASSPSSCSSFLLLLFRPLLLLDSSFLPRGLLHEGGVLSCLEVPASDLWLPVELWWSWVSEYGFMVVVLSKGNRLARKPNMLRMQLNVPHSTNFIQNCIPDTNIVSYLDESDFMNKKNKNKLTNLFSCKNDNFI